MNSPDVPAVQALLQMSGFAAPADDADSLSDLLNAHLEATGRLFEVDTSGVEPAVTFDASWD